MKTKEQRKAELCDKLAIELKTAISLQVKGTFSLRKFLNEYDEIEASKPLSKDPYADEVFGGHCGSRLITAAVHHLGLRQETAIDRKDMRLSHMPTLGWYKNTRRIGKKSLWVYEEVMKEYGFTEKLQ